MNKIVVGLVMLAMTVTNPAIANTANDEQAVRKVIADYGDAWNKHDPDAILALFTDDADWVNVAGSWWHGQAEHRRGTTWVHEHVFKNAHGHIGAVVVRFSTQDTESFTVSKQGVITSFNPFGAPSSFASAVSPSGTVVGIYTDSSGVTHGYQLYQGSFTSNDFPGSIFTFNGGINATGDIVGSYTDTSNVTHSFLLSHGVYTGFDPPGATLSEASGINPSGAIVGVYLDSANVWHGFIRTP